MCIDRYNGITRSFPVRSTGEYVSSGMPVGLREINLNLPQGVDSMMMDRRPLVWGGGGGCPDQRIGDGDSRPLPTVLEVITHRGNPELHPSDASLSTSRIPRAYIMLYHGFETGL